MKSLLSTFLFSFLPLILVAQTNPKLTDDEILKLYHGLRVADVSDGMDLVGLKDVGLLDPEIEALWKILISSSICFAALL